MQRWNYSTAILSFVLITIVAAGVVYVNGDGEKKYDAAQAPASSADVHAWFADLLSARDAHAAYEDFKHAFSNDHFNVQHNAAHLVGELLYVHEGVSGVVVCDSTFAFGCYHGFFGRAIGSEGMQIVPALDDACIEAFGPLGVGCQHGIGHGLIEYLGHSSEDIRKGLAMCAKLTWQEDLFGCQGGVFMEYHFPIIFDDGKPSSTVRPFDAATPYVSCDDIPERFLRACFFSLPQWWNVSLEAREMGELCAAVSHAGRRNACYLGLGNVVGPDTNYDPQASIGMCDRMPTTSGMVYCRAGASWSFYASPDVRDSAPAVCKGLEPDEKAFCLREAELVDEDLQNVYSGEQ